MLKQLFRDRKTSWIAISLILALLIGVLGCSGGPKKDPTFPLGSKNRETGNNPPGNGATGYGTEGKILQELTGNKGEQGGQLYKGIALFGVYDAETGLPIEDAIVSLGDDGTISGATDQNGIVKLENLAGPGGGPIIGGSEPDYPIATAGAEGYELKSYGALKYSVCAFYLQSLDTTPPQTGTISGSVDFKTDQYSAEVYATGMTSFTDALLVPTGAGDESDTFEITVEALKSGVFICVWRDPATTKIIRYFTTRYTILPDETFTLNTEYKAIGDMSDDNGGQTSPDIFPVTWQEFIPISRACSGSVILVEDLAPEIQSFNVSTYVYDKQFGYLPFNDLITYSTKPGNDDRIKLFDTRCMIAPPPTMPFQMQQVWADVVYNDGSGSSLLLAFGPFLPQNPLGELHTPPVISAPLNGALSVGLTPEITWTIDSKDSSFESVIMLKDNTNGNTWRIYSDPGTDTVTLPTLPAGMSGWGLTEGNDLSAKVDIDLSMASSVDQSGARAIIPPGAEYTPKNFSKVYTFTP